MKLTLANGKKYLIGSYQPEKLPAVIKTAVEHLATGNQGLVDFSGVIPVGYQPPNVDSGNYDTLEETIIYNTTKVETAD